MTRGLGYRPDPPGHCRSPFARLSSARGMSTAWRPPAFVIATTPGVFDQGGTKSCTGHAASGCIATALNVVPPSPAEIYRNGRAIDREGHLFALADDGAMPNQVFRAANEFGVRSMRGRAADGRYSDADPATINDEPMLGDLEEEALMLLVGEYGITARGAQRLGEVCAAIAGGIPVAAAIAGGAPAFQDYTGGVLSAMRAPLDHYVFLYGYETLPSGALIIRGRNSWGAWGEAGPRGLGDFLLDESALDELGDLVATRVRRIG